jgi:hypothetical protein
MPIQFYHKPYRRSRPLGLQVVPPPGVIVQRAISLDKERERERDIYTSILRIWFVAFGMGTSRGLLWATPSYPVTRFETPRNLRPYPLRGGEGNHHEDYGAFALVASDEVKE